MASVAILGGGIAGLSCAHYLSTLGRDFLKKITLVERSTNFGGWIQTTRFPDGTIYEHGPRSLRVSGTAGYNSLCFADELGLSSEVVPVKGNHIAANKRLILLNGKLHTLPSRPSQLFTIVPPLSKPLLWYVAKDLIARRKKIEDESVHSFFERRFGKETADYIMDPFCRGIMAGDCKKISVKSLLPTVFNAEQEYGSVIKGQLKQAKAPIPEDLLKSSLVKKSKDEGWAMWTLKRGLQQLTETLTDSLERQAVDLQPNTICTHLNFKEGKTVITTGEDKTEFDHVFACVPAERLSHLLPVNCPSLAHNLSLIPSVHVAVVNLEYKGNVLKEEGFGFLVPSTEDCKVLGITFDSCCFPHHDGPYQSKTRITCMMGGQWFREHFGDVNSVTEDSILKIAVETAQTKLGIRDSPVRHHVSIHRRCIPQYFVGHNSAVSAIRKEIKDKNLCLSVVGASYDGVGINDCIYGAKLSVENYVKTL